MISMALQREVPQYMAIPWFITNVIARTISVSHSIICKLHSFDHFESNKNNHFKHLKLTFHRTVDVVSVGKNYVHIIQLES